MERLRFAGLVLLLLGVIWVQGVPSASAQALTTAWLQRLDDDAPREAIIDTCELLGTFGESGPDVLKRLERLLSHPDPKVVATAATAFLSLGGDRATVRAQLSHEKPAVGAAIARVLVGGDEPDPEALRTLLDAVETDWSVAFTLAKFSPDLDSQMTDEVLSRLVARNPVAPMVEKGLADGDALAESNREQTDLFSLLVMALRMEARHAPRLLTLSRSGDAPFDELAALLLVRDLARDPTVREELRADLERSGGNRLAIVAVGVLKSEPEHARAWQMLRLALNDPDPSRGAFVAQTLKDLEFSAAPLLPQLLQGLANPDEEIRKDYVGALVQIGSAAVPAIVERLTGDAKDTTLPEGAWQQIHKVLQGIGEKNEARAAVPLVVARLRQGDQEAIQTLCAIGRDEPLSDVYGPILDGGQGSARRALVDALLDHPPSHAETRAMLQERLPAATKGYRGKAQLLALRLQLAIGSDPVAVGRRLTAELNDEQFPRFENLSLVNQTLQDLGPATAEVIAGTPAYWSGVLPPHNDAMRVDGLAAARERGVPLLIAQLDDPSPATRDQAVSALAEIGPPARAAVPRLIELLQDEALPGKSGKAADEAKDDPLAPSGEPVWLHAAHALGKIGPDAHAALGPLETRLHHSHRHAAVYVLGAISQIAGPDDGRLVGTVRPFLKDTRFYVHANAIATLIRIVPDDPATVGEARSFLKRCRLRDQGKTMVMADWLTVRTTFAELPRHPKLAAESRTDLRSLMNVPLLDLQTRCEVAGLLCQLDPPDEVGRRFLEEAAASSSPFWHEDARSALSRLADEQKVAPVAR